jgi:hypothetical protein
MHVSLISKQTGLPTRVAILDLTIAHKLNAKGNQHIAKAHELSSQQRRGRETNKFADTRMDQGVAKR